MPGVAGRSGGRNARSTQDHKLEGTYRKNRHGGAQTPAPPKGRPVSPKVLHGDALAEWDRMIDRMEQSRTLALVDDAALFQYANLFAEVEQTVAALEQTATLIDKVSDRMAELHDGDLVQAIQQLTELKKLESKHMVQVRQGRMAIRQYLIEFGMTPSARTRVKSGDDDKVADPFDEFMGPTH